MNDFPVIVHLAMRTGLWDRWGETLQVASKKCKAWSYFYVKSSVFGNKNIFPTLIDFSSPTTHMQNVLS